MKSDLFISLTVLLPIINETESLIKTINTIEAENPNKIKQYLLICHPSKTKVDSIKICNDFVNKDPQKYKVIYQKLPLLGGAIRDGFKHVFTSHCLMMSSDLETDPQSVNSMIKLISKSPQSIITATRWTRNNDFNNYGFIKKNLNYIFQKIFSFIYRTNLSDLTFGYRLFPTQIIKIINWEMYDHSFLFETIIKPLKMKINIIEVSSPWHKRIEGISSNMTLNYIKYFYIGFKTIFYNKDKNG